MKIKTVYEAEDGTFWDTEEECVLYEATDMLLKELTGFIDENSDIPYYDCQDLAAYIVAFYDLKKKA